MAQFVRINILTISGYTGKCFLAFSEKYDIIHWKIFLSWIWCQKINIENFISVSNFGRCEGDLGVTWKFVDIMWNIHISSYSLGWYQYLLYIMIVFFWISNVNNLTSFFRTFLGISTEPGAKILYICNEINVWVFHICQIISLEA